MFRRFSRLTLQLIVFVALLFVVRGPMAATAWPPLSPNAPEVQTASMPLLFVENVGQFDANARFQLRGGQGALWLADQVLWLTVVEPRQAAEAADSLGDARPMASEVALAQRGVNIRLSFPGSNPQPHLEPFGRLETSVSFFEGNDPANWRPTVPVWGGVRYADLYPGVDLVLTSADGELVVLFEAAPGAATERVRLHVEGAVVDGLENGMLRLTSEVGAVAFPLPVAAFDISIEGQGPDGEPLRVVSAPLGEPRAGLSPDSPLEDPVGLLYSTFLGGGDNDVGKAIVVDAAGNSYLTGYVANTGFPTTPGVFDPTSNGGTDVFAAKLNASGSGLVYSTYLGGGNPEHGEDIVIDASGNAYITGYTASSNFPVTPGAFNPIYNGSQTDSFVTKLNATGSALLYSTFLGGQGNDIGASIAVDGANNAYITGMTGSANFPTTAGAFDRSYHGQDDAFVTKLNASGSTLLYSTFLGGQIWDRGHSIEVDSSGSATVTGTTASNDFPDTAGAYDTSHNGSDDAFITKLNASGSALLYGTFFGGGSNESDLDITLDGDGHVYLTGTTGSSEYANFPTTPGAFDRTFNGYRDGFVAKLSATGSTLLYSTYLGGADGGEYRLAIAYAGDGNVYLTGWTFSRDFPTTPGALSRNYKGGLYDAFVTKLNASGSALVYSTYLGGSDFDGGSDITVDGDGTAYVIGATASVNFPTTAGGYDVSHNGYDDVFLTRFATLDELQYLPLVTR